MTVHLAGDEPWPVAKARKAARDVRRNSREIA